MILQRYIGRNLVRGWLLVLLVLGAVFGLISFTQELDHTDKAYDTWAVARYTLRILPNQLVTLAPVIALLGAIVALASLDRYKELTVISSAGFPLRKLLAAVLLPTLVFMAGLWLCMEYVTPQMQRAAEEERLRLRSSDDSWIPGGGVWSTDGLSYINLGRLTRDNVPGNIKLYEFDDSGRLLRALYAESALVEPDRRWLFQNVREKVLVDGELSNARHEQLEIPNLWAPDELPTLRLRGDTMHLSVLYRYTRYLAGNGQPLERYLSTFWQKMFMPLTVLAMVLLATPISATVTAGRDRSFGISLGIGAVVGIIFFLGAQVVFALGQLLGLNIVLVALVPALVILLIALYLLRRMRW